MKKMITTLNLLFIVCSVSVGQRTLQIVSDSMSTPFEEVVLANEVYVAEYSSVQLRKYDGSTLATFPYGMENGEQRYFHGSLLSYKGGLFLILTKEGAKYFYVFRDPGFQLLSPFQVVSNLVIYQDRIFLLLDSDGIVKLYSYDGLDLREALPYTFISGDYHDLYVDRDGFSLYIHDRASSIPFLSMYRYTSGLLRNISGFGAFDIRSVVSITGPDNTYFQHGPDIFYYNGVSLTDITPPSISTAVDMHDWKGKLYFTGVTGGLPPDVSLLYSCVSGECDQIPIPEGTLVWGQTTAIYRDKLHVVLRISGIDYIYSYDGTTFTRIFEFPEPTGQPRLIVREGNLLAISNPVLPGFACEYDGATFTVIRTPNEEGFDASLKSTICYHVWSVIFKDAPLADYRFLLAIEVPDSTCSVPVPPVPGTTPAAIIPDRLREFDRFIAIPHVGLEPPWCWTGVDVDWDIVPFCEDPPCPIAKLQGTLTGSQGKIVSSLTDNKPPFSMEFNVTKPYTLSLAVENINGKFDQVLTFDKDLAKNGIDNIKLDIHPKDDYFYMTVVTRKSKQVPFTMTLRSTNGDILWQQNFTAPIDKLIRAFVSKPGAYLQFSIPEDNTAINFYPNPFAETLNIDLSEETAPIVITLTDMNGKVVAQKNVSTSEVHSLSAGNQLPGLYILSIFDGKKVRRELVMLE